MRLVAVAALCFPMSHLSGPWCLLPHCGERRVVPCACVRVRYTCVRFAHLSG